MNDFLKINKELGITIIANMHHVDLALKYATRIIGIKGGYVVFDGNAESVNEEVLFNIYGRTIRHDEMLGATDA